MPLTFNTLLPKAGQTPKILAIAISVLAITT
jgi:hypothetical protein